MQGRVHSIESFGSADGPGVRFLIFLKGCPMRCAYCHNPDTWAGDRAELKSADELLDQAERYRSYWGPEGGITVSGGEGLGQLDFVLGAYLSRGGKSFICLSSTFMNKKTGKLESRIRPTLENGSIVTDTRANVHYLCTEYGCVNLKGLTAWEKAEALISVAHPDFREELIQEAEKMHIWRRSNKI